MTKNVRNVRAEIPVSYAAFNIDNIPHELAARPQFGLWYASPIVDQQHETKITKLPLNLALVREFIVGKYDESQPLGPANLGALSREANPDNETNRGVLSYVKEFAYAMQRAEKKPVGVSIALHGDPELIAFDLDHVLDSAGRIDAPFDVAAFVAEFNTYTEISPSGNGLRLFCFVSPALKETIKQRSRKAAIDIGDKRKSVMHHMFIDTGFVTVTGRRFGSCTRVADCDAIVARKFVNAFPAYEERVASTHYVASLDDTGELEWVMADLSVIDPDIDHDHWVAIGMALKVGTITTTRGAAWGFELWDTWSQGGSLYAKNKRGEMLERYRKFDGVTSHGKRVTLHTLHYIAEQARRATGNVGPTKDEQWKSLLADYDKTLADNEDALDKLAREKGVTVHAVVPLKNGLVSKRGDTVVPEPVRYLVNPILRMGVLNILSGKGGSKKSSVAALIGAYVSRKEDVPWDVLERKQHAKHMEHVFGDAARPYKRSGGVFHFTIEASIEEDVVADYIANNADMSNVHFMGTTVTNGVERSFDLLRDMKKVLQLIIELQMIPDLIEFDPVTSFVSGAFDRNSGGEVRALSQRLNNLARRLGTTIMGSTHHKKGGDEVREDRVHGSIEWTAANRSVVSFIGLREAPVAVDAHVPSMNDATSYTAVMLDKANRGSTDGPVHIFRCDHADWDTNGTVVKHIDAMPRADFERYMSGKQNEEATVAKDESEALVAGVLKAVIDDKLYFATKGAVVLSIAAKCNVKPGVVYGVMNAKGYSIVRRIGKGWTLALGTLDNAAPTQH